MWQFQNLRVLVLGLARSGYAVANLLLEIGAKVTVTDLNRSGSADAMAASLEAKGVRVVLGDHPLTLLEETDLIVKNPGIPYRIPLLVEAETKGIPIITEIEVATQVTQAPFVAITGSNGKTTTTTLLGEMFRQAQQKVVVAGNIGTAVSAIAKEVTGASWLVLEVSSFQLQGTVNFHPKVAVLLNIYPTHLDYHGTLTDYTNAKLRLFANQGAGDVAVLNLDKDNLKELVPSLVKQGVSVHGFSLREPVSAGLFVHDDEIFYQAPDKVTPEYVCHRQELALRGEFNLENALAAGTAAVAAGVPLTAVKAVWKSFQGVEHRLEFVRDVRGIKYYNDSKATNPQAAIRALTSFTEPVVVILGGLERGDDLTPLLEPLIRHAKAVVVLGESAGRMRELATKAGISVIQQVESIEEATLVASRLAKTGDVVLLSPAAASWDMFPSFEVRGSIFKEAVHKL